MTRLLLLSDLIMWAEQEVLISVPFFFVVFFHLIFHPSLSPFLPSFTISSLTLLLSFNTFVKLIVLTYG